MLRARRFFAGAVLCRSALAGLVLSLAACVSPGPARKPAALLQGQAFGLEAGETEFAGASGGSALGDARLSELIDAALKNSPGLQLARSRVERALALADLSRADSSLAVALGADFNAQHYSANGLIPKPIAGNTWESGTVQTSLNWSPDFFGQHAAEWAAALGQARASRADEAAAALALSTQLSRTYVSLARFLALRDVEQKALAQREHIFLLTRARVNAGLDSRVEWLQAEALPPESRGRIEAIDEQVALLRRQIAVLCGQNPDAQNALAPSLEAIRPGAAPLKSLGLDLLGRRPEVVAARWRVEAATQDVTQARSQFYPNLSLTAFVGLSSLGLAQLFEMGSRQMGIAPALRLPLFDGGRLRAHLGARQAELDAAIAQYNQWVLDAIRETGDALASAQSLVGQSRQQADSSRAADLAHQLAMRRYEAGLGSYLLVLHAETQWLAQRRLAIDLQARELDTRLLLIRAIGGGWKEDAALPGLRASGKE